MFTGTHDFTQFANLSSTERVPTKTIRRFDVVDGGPDIGLQFWVQGSAFLYKQVRHMVGATLAVGMGRLDAGRVEELLAVGGSRPVGHRARLWTVAEARGLVLARVVYPPEMGVPAAVAPFPIAFGGTAWDGGHDGLMHASLLPTADPLSSPIPPVTSN